MQNVKRYRGLEHVPRSVNSARDCLMWQKLGSGGGSKYTTRKEMRGGGCEVGTLSSCFDDNQHILIPLKDHSMGKRCSRSSIKLYSHQHPGC
jgi:hypothetical protein